MEGVGNRGEGLVRTSCSLYRWKEAGIDTAWIGLKWSRKNETFTFNELFQNEQFIRL